MGINMQRHVAATGFALIASIIALAGTALAVIGVEATFIAIMVGLSLVALGVTGWLVMSDRIARD
jgi:hypothetical protein